LKPLLTPEQYAIEREICERATVYWKANADYGRGGWSRLSAEKAAHPDYAACSNEMRGRVEQFEILTNPPERLGVYISKAPDGSLRVTVWTGIELGRAYVTSSWRINSPLSSRMYQYAATIAGREYTGRGMGEGMFVSLRLTAEAKRRLAA
jgi:hypothetical protein